MRQFADLILYSGHTVMFMLGVSFLLSSLANILRRGKAGYSVAAAIALGAFGVAASVAGASGLRFLECLPRVMAGESYQMNFSFFGSLLGYPLFMLLVAKLLKLPYGRLTDWTTPGMVLCLVTVRFGCYIQGCCRGITYVTASGATARVPAQLMECGCDIVILLLLLLLEWSVSSYQVEGILYPSFMVLYGCVRFCIEFVRETGHLVLFLSEGQCFSILSVAIGGFILNRIYKEARRSYRQARQSKGKKRKTGKR